MPRLSRTNKLADFSGPPPFVCSEVLVLGANLVQTLVRSLEQHLSGLQL